MKKEGRISGQRERKEWKDGWEEATFIIGIDNSFIRASFCSGTSYSFEESSPGLGMARALA